jgi:hypothetical protein
VIYILGEGPNKKSPDASGDFFYNFQQAVYFFFLAAFFLGAAFFLAAFFFVAIFVEFNV